MRELGGIPLDIIQKYINFWFSYSLDLFGGEISSNSADFFAAGLKGRYNEQELFEDHVAADGVLNIEVIEDNQVKSREAPLRNALNEVLRGEYAKDCERGLARWNKILAEEGVSERLYLPSRRFSSARRRIRQTSFRYSRRDDLTGRIRSSHFRMAADIAGSRIRPQPDDARD